MQASDILPLIFLFLIVPGIIASNAPHAGASEGDSACLLQNGMTTAAVSDEPILVPIQASVATGLPMSSFAGGEAESSLPSGVSSSHAVPPQGHNDRVPMKQELQPVATLQLSSSVVTPVASKNVVSQKHEPVAMMQHSSTADSRLGCREVYGLVPLFGSFLVSVAVVAVWLSFDNSNAGTAEVARCVSLFIQFCGVANFFIVIFQAASLAKMVGQHEAFSQTVIGVHILGNVIGGVAAASTLWCSPGIWRTHVKPFLLSCQTLQIIGFCIQTWIAPSAFLHSSSALLMGCFISGLGHGFSATLLQVSFAHLTQATDRPAQMTRFALVNALGIGFGLVLTSTIDMMAAAFCPSGPSPGAQVSGIVQLVLTAGAICASILFYPSLRLVGDFADSNSWTHGIPVESVDLTPRSRGLHKVILYGCILNSLVRATITSGVEAAALLLLKSEYNVTSRYVALIVGAMLLCTLPAKLLVDRLNQSLTVTVYQWFRTFCTASIVGSILLFCYSGPCLVVAGTLLLPSLYLSDGMIKGLMQQYALPTGSCLDQTGTTLWMMMLISIGRFLGPCLAYALLEKTTHTGYAVIQVLLIGVFWASFEALIFRPARAVEAMNGSHTSDGKLVPDGKPVGPSDWVMPDGKPTR